MEHVRPLLASTVSTSPGLCLTEHTLRVPLDHRDPGAAEQVEIFAREVADPEGPAKPYLVYLQGGPGLDTPRPLRRPTTPSWLDRALQDYRVLLVDQRGTGRSTPVGPLPGRSPAEQAGYLSRFRADSIVADLELLRQALGVDSWSVLGQSFGGFCALRYLSAAPGSLREVFFTGGLPPVDKHVDDVYRATFATMLERNRRFYASYPGDRERVAALHERLDGGDLVLPTGDRLTSRVFRQVGNMLGLTHGAEQLHYLLERDPASPEFLHAVANDAIPFTGRKPLFALLQEACYANGHATRWSAQRTMPDAFHDDVTLFTGEHVFPWTYSDLSEMRHFEEAAHLLAEHAWEPLYDVDVLRANEVPCAAVIYADDAFVDRDFSLATAALVPGLHTWVTPDLEHDGLKVSGDVVLDRLITLVRAPG